MNLPRVMYIKLQIWDTNRNKSDSKACVSSMSVLSSKSTAEGPSGARI